MWTDRRSGTLRQRGTNDHRDPYERDRTRVIHCPAFRRLQRKTQILGTDEGDFHRTRLTHSLEVASIGRSIVRNLALKQQSFHSLLPSDDLISVICLLHDIGHPPFGHGGEVALNYMMHRYGGFEGNAQTLRLLTKVENSYGAYGLDLTRRALLGILKYPVNRAKALATETPGNTTPWSRTIRINDWTPPKAYFDCEQTEVSWILAPLDEADRTLFQSLAKEPTEKNHGRAAFHSFDCSIMDVADDIAYGVHDLEDAIHLNLIRREQFDNAQFRTLFQQTSLGKTQPQLLKALFHADLALRKQAIGDMVHYFITATQISAVDERFSNELLRYNVYLLPEAAAMLQYLIACIHAHVIDSQEARTSEYGGQSIILRLFEAISSNPSALLDQRNRAHHHSAGNEWEAFRIIADYIANMTDEYAHRFHERLFGFNTRTIFERL